MNLKRLFLASAVVLAYTNVSAQTVTIGSATVVAGAPAVKTTTFSSGATALGGVQADFTFARPPGAASALVTAVPGAVLGANPPVCTGNSTTGLTLTGIRGSAAASVANTAIGQAAAQIICTHTIPTSPTAVPGVYPFTNAVVAAATPAGVKVDTITVGNGLIVGSITITAPPAAANVAQTPPALAFGASNQTVPTATQNLVLTNSTVNAGSVTCTISGANAGDFAFFPAVAGGVVAIPAAIGPVNVPIRFTPSAAGARAGSVACVGTGATVVTGSPTALTGTGNAPLGANVAQTPVTIPFGSSTTGVSTATQNLVLTNSTAIAGSVTCTISGANAADFAFFPAVAGGVVAIPAVVGPVNVPVRFTPSVVGAAVASIACVGTGTTVVTGSPTALTGAGTAPLGANVAQTPATIPFAATNVGVASATQNLVLTNSTAIAGSATCTISGANAADFAFFPAVAGGVVAIPAAIGAVNVPVRFTPSAAGARVGSIACVGTGTTVVTGSPTALTGTGTAVLNFTLPTSSAVAPISIGTTVAGTQIGPVNILVSAPIGNTGPVTIVSCTAINSTPAGLFNYGNPPPVFPISIIAGGSVNIPVFYNPPVGAPVGVYPGDFTCTTGAGNTPATFQVFVTGSVRAAAVPLVTQVPTLSTLSVWLLVASMLGFGLVMVRRQS